MDEMYNELKKVLRDRISDYLDSLPMKEKEERLLVPFVPVIPDDEETKQYYIDDAVHPFEKDEVYAEADLSTELVQRIEHLDLDIDTSLPIRTLQAELRRRLEAMDDQQRLSIGLYGKPTTPDQLEYIREMQIDGLMMHLQLAALNTPAEVLNETLKLVDLESLKEQTKIMRTHLINVFPGEIQAVRMHEAMRRMGFFDPYRVNTLNALKLN